MKVVEGERTRTQAFEGVCIARSNKGLNSNFTVRKISYGEGVERVFPLYSPTDRRDRGGAPRRCASGQAVLSARPFAASRARIAERARSTTETPAAAAEATAAE